MAGVVVNRVLPELFGTREEQVFEALAAPAASDQLTAALGGPAEPLIEAARLMVRMRRARAAHLDRLREAVGRHSSAGAEFFMSRLCSCARTVCALPIKWRRPWLRS